MTETNEIGNKWVGRVPISLGHGWFSKQLSCGGSGFLPAGARAEAHIEDNNWSIPATALSSIEHCHSHVTRAQPNLCVRHWHFQGELWELQTPTQWIFKFLMQISVSSVTMCKTKMWFIWSQFHPTLQVILHLPYTYTYDLWVDVSASGTMLITKCSDCFSDCVPVWSSHKFPWELEIVLEHQKTVTTAPSLQDVRVQV